MGSSFDNKGKVHHHRFFPNLVHDMPKHLPGPFQGKNPGPNASHWFRGRDADMHRGVVTGVFAGGAPGYELHLNPPPAILNGTNNNDMV
jgi:hypothetical protein